MTDENIEERLRKIKSETTRDNLDESLDNQTLGEIFDETFESMDQGKKSSEPNNNDVSSFYENTSPSNEEHNSTKAITGKVVVTGAALAIAGAAVYFGYEPSIEFISDIGDKVTAAVETVYSFRKPIVGALVGIPCGILGSYITSPKETKKSEWISSGIYSGLVCGGLTGWAGSYDPFDTYKVALISGTASGIIGGIIPMFESKK